MQCKGCVHAVLARAQEILADKLKLLNYEAEFCRRKWVAGMAPWRHAAHVHALRDAEPPAQQGVALPTQGSSTAAPPLACHRPPPPRERIAVDL